MELKSSLHLTPCRIRFCLLIERVRCQNPHKAPELMERPNTCGGRLEAIFNILFTNPLKWLFSMQETTIGTRSEQFKQQFKEHLRAISYFSCFVGPCPI